MKKNLILIAFAIGVVFSSCRNYPDYESLTYKAIVVTNHDPKSDFSQYKTYFLPPFVGTITDNPLDSILSGDVGDPILNAIDKNMQSRGFVKVNKSDSADIGIGVVTLSSTYVGYYYPGYWWGYGYGYYGGYYPYYPYSYSYSYTTGSMAVDLIDLKNADKASNRVNILWTSFSNGILGYSNSVTLATDAINQSFTQSPYIKTK